MIKGIDHVVVLVKNLDQAVADYKQLGFNVAPGGEHTDGATHNALIAFADGSYIELIAFKREAPEHRWWRHTRNIVRNGEGLIDFALLPTDIANDIAAARQRGLDYQGPFPGGRQRPDGQQIKWQTGQPTTPDLPFLCGDVTPRTLRVPSGPAWVHPNGVTGIAAVTMLVTDLEESAGRYKALLGIAPHGLTEEEIADAKEKGFTNLNFFKTFELGPGKISLVSLGIDTREVGKSFTDENGEGPFGLSLKAPRPGEFDSSLTHHVSFSVSSKAGQEQPT
jgi:catechol 2,3-dioxygenase-like lactoylglutathione lyase family enzyme